MKKVISLFLTLVLTLSLTIAAFAVLALPFAYLLDDIMPLIRRVD